LAGYLFDLGMQVRSRRETTARWLLGGVTFVLMASMGGGFLLLPILVPAHIWAASRSGPTGLVGWSLLPAASLAMLAWAAVYLMVGESKPSIWLVPVLVLVVTLTAVMRFTPHHRGLRV
jgi:hypothetical protein